MIKKLLLITLLTFGLSNELSTSVSVRTPNDDDKPLDYEYSIKVEDTNDKFQYLLKRDWERELGEKYIDDIAKFSHKVGTFYYGVDYVDKESKDIFYTTYNVGWQHNTGFKVGLSLKDETPLLDVGFNRKIKNDDIEYLVGISFKTDLDENIINVKSEVKKWFTERVNIFALYKKEYYNTQEDFQFKVGIGVKLWN